MLHAVAFHQGLHSLIRQKRSSEKEIQFDFEIITCDLLIAAMICLKFIVLYQVYKGLFLFLYGAFQDATSNHFLTLIYPVFKLRFPLCLCNFMLIKS